jgi:hypothetical protein
LIKGRNLNNYISPIGWYLVGLFYLTLITKKMVQEKNTIIKYEGNCITLLSDDRNDYLNLTEIAKAWKKGKKPLRSWLKNKQTLDFLKVWERKNNPVFREAQMGTVLKAVKDSNFSMSVKYWSETTGAIGIFTKQGGEDGTSAYAHKDIAIRFAGWLNPEFELYLVEEIQRLKKIEDQKHSFELLTHQQIIALVRLKEIFKYVTHQEIVEDAHKEVYASKSASKLPFADFHKWRNKILDISAEQIDERIKQYCIDNKIPLTKKMMNRPKREKIIIYDTYETVKIAVWDFLQMKGEVNALNLANLVGDMIRTEKGEIQRANEDTLFTKKQSFGEISDFKQTIADMSVVRTARQVLEYRAKMIGKPGWTK